MRYTAAHWGSYSITEQGDLAPLEDDPAPSRIGRGWLSAARDSQSRIARPAVRRGWLDGDKGAGRCTDSFVEIGWDEMTDMVATELRRVIDTRGNDAVYAGSYGWASTGRFNHAQSQLRRFLNLCGGFASSRDTYSHAAAEVILPWITGKSNRAFQDDTTSWPLIAEHCQVLLTFGGLSGRTAQVNSSGTGVHEMPYWLRKTAENGCRIINVSPLKSDMEAVPDAEWLTIRPGTDRALMLALCHVLLDTDQADKTFLETYTSGWPEFRAYLLGQSDGVAKTAEWASALCDIPAERIRSLASELSRHRSMITCTWSMQRADHGELTLWAGLALAAMLGQIGQPGTGFGFGYGSVTSVGRPARLIPWPSVPQGRNPVNTFIPVARIADMLLNPGRPFTYDGRSLTYPDIALIWWAGGNPFHHHQDLNRLEKAWTRPETVIVQDHSWTATARRADIVLPATSPLERNDIMMNRRDPTLLYMSALDAPYQDALDDFEIFRRISAKLDLEDAFTEGRTAQDWLGWIWQKAEQVGNEHGFALPDFETFRETQRFDIPDAEECRILFGDFIADPDANPLQTESGKLVLFSPRMSALNLDDNPGFPAWLAPAESLLDAPDGALHLISGQPDTRLHAQNDRGCEAQADKISGREACYLHPETAARFGLADGSVIKLHNARGTCLAGLRLSTGMRKDCVALATGAWFDPIEINGEVIEVHGNPNALTLDKGTTGLAQGNIAHTALVFVEPWTGSLPEKTVDRLPVFVGRDDIAAQ